MTEVRSIEVDRWGEPDAQRRISHIGMRSVGEVYQELKACLEKKGMLPDEYFDLSWEVRDMGELPDYDYAICTPNFGGSEGVYLDITLRCGNREFEGDLSFITGKTLKEGADAFDWMARIAAECSLLLNGRGRVYHRESVHLVLESAQAEYLKSILWQEMESAGGEEQDMAPAILRMLV